MVKGRRLQEGTSAIRLVGCASDRCARREANRCRADRVPDGNGPGRWTVRLRPETGPDLWQCMGMLQYKIPLDSRIANWVNKLPLTFGMEPKRLYASVNYYEDKMAEIQAICQAAGVLPCELDAAVFVSSERQSRRSALTRRAPALEDVRAVRAILMAAPAASEHVNVLAVIRAR